MTSVYHSDKYPCPECHYLTGVCILQSTLQSPWLITNVPTSSSPMLCTVHTPVLEAPVTRYGVPTEHQKQGQHPTSASRAFCGPNGYMPLTKSAPLPVTSLPGASSYCWDSPPESSSSKWPDLRRGAQRKSSEQRNTRTLVDITSTLHQWWIRRPCSTENTVADPNCTWDQ